MKGRTKPQLPKNVLISSQEIATRIAELARDISKDYARSDLLALIVLRGSFMFAADLVRALSPTLDVAVDFIILQSYGDSTSSSGNIDVVYDMQLPARNKDVLIIEDIVDTGLTIDFLRQRLETQDARSIRVATLLRKNAKAGAPGNLDYVGFSIPDVFVVGYGLDLAQLYRNLPDIRLLDER